MVTKKWLHKELGLEPPKAQRTSFQPKSEPQRVKRWGVQRQKKTDTHSQIFFRKFLEQLKIKVNLNRI